MESSCKGHAIGVAKRPRVVRVMTCMSYDTDVLVGGLAWALQGVDWTRGYPFVWRSTTPTYQPIFSSRFLHETASRAWVPRSVDTDVALFAAGKSMR